jgi:hypothetical protein
MQLAALIEGKRNELQRRWAQRIEPEALPCVDHGQLARHGENRALAGCVCELRRGRSDEADNTRGVDDARLVLAVLAEAQHGMLAAEPHALDVDGLGQVPDLLGGVDGVVVVGVHDARVVEDDVQTAPGVDGGDHGLDVGLLGHVADLGVNLERLCAGNDFVQLCQRLFQSGPRDVGHQNVGALAREQDACLQPNAAASR